MNEALAELLRKERERAEKPVLAVLLPFSLCVIIVSPVLHGWVVTHLWRWFVLPLFPAMPALGIVQAIGLVLTVRVLTGERAKQEDKSKTPLMRLAEATGAMLLGPLIVLGMGWLIHLFL